MAYDSVRQRVVLFGGYKFTSAVADTWEWDGLAWTQMKPTASPPARYDHAMAYDPTSGRVVLFAGRMQSPRVADTWEWDGKTWMQMKPASLPGRRSVHAMAYDVARRRAMFFGGNGPNNGYHGDTWLCRPAFLFGTFQTFGSGCGGPPGVTLAAAPGSRPTTGKPFLVNLSNLPLISTSALMSLGLSRTFLGPFPLPINLAPFGMPGCFLYHSYDVQWLFPVKNGSGQFSLPIPGDQVFAGTRSHLQAIVVAPRVNPAGLLSSNAGEMLIGNK